MSHVVVRRRAAAAAIGAALLMPGPGRGTPAAEPARVGLVPYLSPRALLALWEPLRAHLAEALDRPVEFYSSASLEAMYANALRPDQPFSLLPAHFAKLAIDARRFVLVARQAGVTTLHLWAPRGGAEAAVRPGSVVATIDELSLHTLMFMRWLDRPEAAALQLRVTPHPTLSAALIAVQRGEAALLAATDGQVRDVPAAAALGLQPALRVGELLPPAFVARPEVPPLQVAAFRAALLNWQPAQAAGTSSARWVVGRAADLSSYEPLADALRGPLGEPARAPR